MQNNSINRARINWTDFRNHVFQRAQGAQTISEAIADDSPVVNRAIAWLRGV